MPQKETLEIGLKYLGPDVDDGTMSIEDIVPVLQGFSSAYGKLAAREGISGRHKLRITGVSKGSATILLEVWEVLGQNSPQIQALGVLSTAGLFIIQSILKVIQLKKFTRNEPITEKISGNNNICISNSAQVTIEMPVSVFTINKEKSIDSDLAKLVSPLEENKVTDMEITARNRRTGETINESINCSEKKYFQASEIVVTSTQEVWLLGMFNSLTKSTGSGYFILQNGDRVFYNFQGESEDQLHLAFIHKGQVRVRCVAHMDSNLKPERLEIFEIQIVQPSLFADQEGETDPGELPS